MAAQSEDMCPLGSGTRLAQACVQGSLSQCVGPQCQPCVNQKRPSGVNRTDKKVMRNLPVACVHAAGYRTVCWRRQLACRACKTHVVRPSWANSSCDRAPLLD